MKIFEIFSALLVIALTIILGVTWNHDASTLEMSTEVKNDAATIEKIKEEKSYVVASEEIASLFGWVKKQDVTPVGKNTNNEINNASGIRYLGHIMKSNGQRHYFFKNDKNSDLFSLTEGSEHEGWKLLQIADEGFIFEYENNKYFVKK